jgi:acetylornithine deacetylase/succinyl-diaminopimelate desuccinylase-like protein
MISKLTENMFEYVDRNERRIVEEIIEICETPAPTFHEQKRIKYIANRMKKIGLENVKIDKIGNAIGMIKGKFSKVNILITAHADTVFEEKNINVKRIRNELHAPGVLDNSTGVEALLFLAETLKKYIIPKGNLFFASTVMEEREGNSRGMEYLLKNLGKKVEVVINVEGIKFGRITNTAVGVRRVKIYFETKGGHAWRNFGRLSAINEACEAIHKFSRISIPPKTSYNVGVIYGGHSVNAIAERANFLLEMRATSEENLKRLTEGFYGIIKSSKAKTRIEEIGYKPPGSISEESRLVRLIKDVHRELKIKTIMDEGTTDGNISIHMGIPTVTLGITEGENTHSVKEKMSIEKIPLGIKQLILSVIKIDEEFK